MGYGALSHKYGSIKQNWGLCKRAKLTWMLCYSIRQGATGLSSQIFNKKSGSINNFRFKYYGGRTILSNNIFRKKLDIFFSNWDMCLSMIKEKKNDKTDAIIYYSSSTSKALLIFFITRIKKILLLKEESELSLEKKYFI